jgi:hypothetical protein
VEPEDAPLRLSNSDVGGPTLPETYAVSEFIQPSPESQVASKAFEADSTDVISPQPLSPIVRKTDVSAPLRAQTLPEVSAKLTSVAEQLPVAENTNDGLTPNLKEAVVVVASQETKGNSKPKMFDRAIDRIGTWLARKPLAMPRQTEKDSSQQKTLPKSILNSVVKLLLIICICVCVSVICLCIAVAFSQDKAIALSFSARLVALITTIPFFLGFYLCYRYIRFNK